MSQATQIRDRRSDRRLPAAFAFWFQPGPERPRASGWMLNISAGGASFLTSADSVPAADARIALREMFAPNWLIRQLSAELPAVARVLRVEDEAGMTRRVAVRFESQVTAAQQVRSQRTGTAQRRATRPAPVPPPSAVQPERHTFAAPPVGR